MRDIKLVKNSQASVSSGFKSKSALLPKNISTRSNKISPPLRCFASHSKTHPWKIIFHYYAKQNAEVMQIRVFVDLYEKKYRRKANAPLLEYVVPLLPPAAPSFLELIKEFCFGCFFFLKTFFGRFFAGFLAKFHLSGMGIIIILMFLSFLGGMVAVLGEHRSLAQQSPNQFIPQTFVNSSADIALESLASLSLTHGPDALVKRKASLKKYLMQKNSPFYEDEEAINMLLALPHLKLILAISYAESTMGKNCYYNNCSGIGGYVPNLRKYKEFKNWMVDLNDLLERKYKNWTLEQMCGVYVQPCNSGWLKATKQVLAELDLQEIN